MALDLSVKLGPLELSSPLMTASGCSGYGKELNRYHDLAVYGALVGKSISRNPRLGNPYPRTAETSAGLINAIGLQNEGYEAFIKNTLPPMRSFGPKAVVNVVGHDFGLERHLPIFRTVGVVDQGTGTRDRRGFVLIGIAGEVYRGFLSCVLKTQSDRLPGKALGIRRLRLFHPVTPLSGGEFQRMKKNIASDFYPGFVVFPGMSLHQHG